MLFLPSCTFDVARRVFDIGGNKSAGLLSNIAFSHRIRGRMRSRNPPEILPTNVALQQPEWETVKIFKKKIEIADAHRPSNVE